MSSVATDHGRQLLGRTTLRHAEGEPGLGQPSLPGSGLSRPEARWSYSGLTAPSPLAVRSGPACTRPARCIQPSSVNVGQRNTVVRDGAPPCVIECGRTGRRPASRSVATALGGHQNHRHHRSPGAHPVAPTQIPPCTGWAPTRRSWARLHPSRSGQSSRDWPFDWLRETGRGGEHIG